MKTFKQLMEEIPEPVTPKQFDVYKSDLRFIRKISPGLEFGLVGKTMHKVDEAVSLKDLKNLKKIYENILINYFK